MAKVLKWLAGVAGAVCCHRVIYGGVALAYGAGLSGLCDRDMVEATVLVAYALMAARG